MAGGLTLGTLGIVAPVIGGPMPSAAAAQTPNATVLAAQSMKALSAVSTFTLNGFMDKAGHRTSFVVRSTDDGAVANARITVGPVGGAPKETAQLVKEPSAVYLKANQRFWAAASSTKLPTPVLREIGNHWVRIPSSKVKSLKLGMITVSPRVAQALLGGKAAAFTTGPVGTVRGVRTRALADPDQKAVLYTSLASHRPVLAQRTRPGADAAAIIFSYPSALRITAPKGAVPFSTVQRQLQGVPSTGTTSRS